MRTQSLSVEYLTNTQEAQGFENVAMASDSPLQLLPQIRVDSKKSGYYIRPLALNNLIPPTQVVQY
jgi:hypothetical protein